MTLSISEANNNEKFKISVYNKFDDELRSIWGLVEITTNPYIFQRYSWNEYWYKIFENVVNLHIVAVSKNNTPIAIFPFCTNTKGIIKKLRFIGYGQSDYQTPILTKGTNISSDILEQVFSRIKSKYDVILLENIPQKIKSEKNLFVDIIPVTKHGVAYSADLPDNYQRYESSLKKSFRGDNRRNEKKLKLRGILQFKNIIGNVSDHSEHDEMINIALEQKQRRLKNHYGNSLLENKNVQEFYKKSFLLIDPNYKLDFMVLKVDDTILATHWGFYDKDTYYYLFPTMEGREWYKYSCGKILNNHLIKQAIAKQLTRFDFTIGDEQYKKNWCNLDMELYNYTKAHTMKGLIFYYGINLWYGIQHNQVARALWRKMKAQLIKDKKKN